MVERSIRLAAQFLKKNQHVIREIRNRARLLQVLILFGKTSIFLLFLPIQSNFSNVLPIRMVFSDKIHKKE